MRVALRARLGLPRPAADVVSSHTTHCQHRNASSGALCGFAMGDDASQHPRACDIGGALTYGHNQVRDWLASLLERWTGHRTQTEQVVNAWSSEEAGLARLDVVFSHEGKTSYVDVAVVNAFTTDADELPRRAQSDGRAASLEVSSKRTRYKPSLNPSCGLVPFVVEALGRPAPETAELLRSVAPSHPGLRARELGAAWQDLSCLIQGRLAEALSSAEHPSAPR